MSGAASSSLSPDLEKDTSGTTAVSVLLHHDSYALKESEKKKTYKENKGLAQKAAQKSHCDFFNLLVQHQYAWE